MLPSLPLLGAVASLAVPAPAEAFRDRVIRSAPRATASAAATAHTAAYAASDGATVAVTFAAGAQQDTTLARSYVNFLDRLPHGSELDSLHIRIVPGSQVARQCGGQEGTLACYQFGTSTMTVPDSGLGASSQGFSTGYVIAHEYGHHIARHRDNSPFPSIDYGPRYWASYEAVCARTIAGRLAPGDENENYLYNPGEAWADTYAHLAYPDHVWQFADLLRPDAGAYAAARKDVLHPWQRSVARTFQGTSAASQSFRFTLHLDGPLRIRLSGPRTSRFRLVLRSSGKTQASRTSSGGSATISYPAACRDRAAETLTATVTRVAGSGSPVLRVSYAG